MQVSGVVGVAQGLDGATPCILIMAAERTAEVARIPSSLDGYRVRVEVTGEFRALDGGEGGLK